MARILVIDDHPAIRRTLRRILALDGHDVSEADGGREALDLIAHDSVDLVITDINMPEGDGMELLLRLAESSPGLGVIAISGGGRISKEELLADASLFGAVATLAKPLTVKETLAAVRSVLADRGPA